jgi:hypothetical protein
VKRISLWSAVMLLSTLGAVHANECKGVDFPEHLQVDGSDLTLNGLGMRKATFLKVNVYVAALYVAHPSRDPPTLVDPSTPGELILHFVRSVGVEDLRNAWKEGFEKTGQSQMAALSGRVATLSAWMSDIKTGQSLTFTRLPGAGIRVDVNGVLKGTIPGDDFARALVSIWLGPSPPNPELKSGLLGGTCE